MQSSAQLIQCLSIVINAFKCTLFTVTLFTCGDFVIIIIILFYPKRGVWSLCFCGVYPKVWLLYLPIPLAKSRVGTLCVSVGVFIYIYPLQCCCCCCRGNHNERYTVQINIRCSKYTHGSRLVHIQTLWHGRCRRRDDHLGIMSGRGSCCVLFITRACAFSRYGSHWERTT